MLISWDPSPGLLVLVMQGRHQPTPFSERARSIPPGRMHLPVPRQWNQAVG